MICGILICIGIISLIGCLVLLTSSPDKHQDAMHPPPWTSTYNESHRTFKSSPIRCPDPPSYLKEKKMCEPVVAFRSKNGKLYESKEECSRHNKVYEDEQTQKKIKTVFEHVIRDPYPNHHPLYDTSWILEQNQRDRDLKECITNWKYLRNALNAIESE